MAERNALLVEIMTNPEGQQAIWVLPLESQEFEVAGVTASMRIGVVATPFMVNLPFDGASPQLIDMLAARGYA